MYLAVYIIISMMYGHTNIKFISSSQDFRPKFRAQSQPLMLHVPHTVFYFRYSLVTPLRNLHHSTLFKSLCEIQTFITFSTQWRINLSKLKQRTFNMTQEYTCSYVLILEYHDSRREVNTAQSALNWLTTLTFRVFYKCLKKENRHARSELQRWFGHDNLRNMH